MKILLFTLGFRAIGGAMRSVCSADLCANLSNGSPGECRDSRFWGAPYLRLVEAFDDGEALFEAAKHHRLGGVVSKRKAS